MKKRNYETVRPEPVEGRADRSTSSPRTARVVTRNSVTKYYTDDHYETFTPFE
ncbi:MAG: hypothetical protein HYX85_02785 [Chloroflexi bacterium]|nr:hypothetical protein [Chloroflexota bacterium]